MVLRLNVLNITQFMAKHRAYLTINVLFCTSNELALPITIFQHNNESLQHTKRA